MEEKAGNESEARFATVVKAFARNPSVSLSKAGSRLFGSQTLKVHRRIFAMLSSSGQFVVKLPKARVDALVAGAAGQRFKASQGRPLKDWLEVHSESADEWLHLACEAIEFVGT